MAKTKKEDKKEEKIYTIPLRKEWLKVPKYRRAKKAIKAIKEFIARHMKIYDRDLKKIKIDKWVNEAVWLRGIKKPPQKIIVKAIKEGNIVKVEFQGLPPKFKIEEEKLKKKIEKAKKREEEKKKTKKEEKKPEKKEEKSEEEKKKEEERKEREKVLHKEISTMKARPKLIEKQKQPKPVIQRKALEK